MAKKIKGVTPSPSEPLENLDLDEALPPLEEDPKPASKKDSTVNLDEYGIWVKAEPEDFTAEESFDEPEIGLEDLSPDEAGKEPERESDAGMIDDLDIPEEEPLAGLEEPGAEPFLTLEEESAPEAEAGGEEIIAETASAAAAAEEIPALEEDLSLGEELPSLEEEPPVVETVVREEEETAVAPEEKPAPAMAGGDFEEVSLDDLGIEISAEAPAAEAAKPAAKRPPAAAPAVDEAAPHVIDDEFASLSLELDGGGEGEAGAQPEEKGALELEELELPLEEAPEPAAPRTAEAGEAEVAPFEDLTGPETLEEIPELELGPEEPVDLGLEKEEAGEEIEVPLSEEVAIAESEEELGGLEAGLSGGEKAAAPSSSILKNIEAELRSIKAELAQLKSELGTLRGAKAAERGEGRKQAKETAAAGGDFFEDEEDETIALTGEELDNIMTTADIKEEAKTEPPAAEAEAPEAELELGEDIIGYEEQPELEAAPAPAEEKAEPIGFEEVPVDKGEGVGEGEIEIEIPELEGGAEETPAAGAAEEVEPVEELGPEEGLESSGAPAFEDTLEEVGELELEPESAAAPEKAPAPGGAPKSDMQLPAGLKEEIKSVLGYMDQLLESLPEEKIEEFAKSEYFSIYKKLFEELGLVS